MVRIASLIPIRLRYLMVLLIILGQGMFTDSIDSTLRRRVLQRKTTV